MTPWDNNDGDNSSRHPAQRGCWCIGCAPTREKKILSCKYSSWILSFQVFHILSNYLSKSCLTNEEEEAGGDEEQGDKRKNTIGILRRCTHFGKRIPYFGITDVQTWKPVKVVSEFFNHWSWLTVSETFSLSEWEWFFCTKTYLSQSWMSPCVFYTKMWLARGHSVDILAQSKLSANILWLPPPKTPEDQLSVSVVYQ